jgi:hypothetical protein
LTVPTADLRVHGNRKVCRDTAAAARTASTVRQQLLADYEATAEAATGLSAPLTIIMADLFDVVGKMGEPSSVRCRHPPRLRTST